MTLIEENRKIVIESEWKNKCDIKVYRKRKRENNILIIGLQINADETRVLGQKWEHFNP